MQVQSGELEPRAAERLLVAVLNQAVLDVLEDGEQARNGEHWLLSKDFALQNLFH